MIPHTTIFKETLFLSISWLTFIYPQGIVAKLVSQPFNISYIDVVASVDLSLWNLGQNSKKKGNAILNILLQIYSMYNLYIIFA